MIEPLYDRYDLWKLHNFSDYKFRTIPASRKNEKETIPGNVASWGLRYFQRPISSRRKTGIRSYLNCVAYEEHLSGQTEYCLVVFFS